MLRIGELSARTGISTDLLRMWERRYGLLTPRRSDGGYRLYATTDIARVRLMQHYLDQGVAAAQAARLVREARAGAVDAHPGLPKGDVQAALRILRTSLEAFDDAPAEEVMGRLLRNFSPALVLRDVLLPFLAGIGDRWACGEVTVAQEHFASQFCETRLRALARGWGRGGDRCAVLACAPGERHQLGLMTFGIVLRNRGWRIVFLGADTPLVCVRQAAEATGASAVVMSATRDDLLHGCRRELVTDETTPLFFGGAGATGDVAASARADALPADVIVAAQELSSHVDGSYRDAILV